MDEVPTKYMENMEKRRLHHTPPVLDGVYASHFCKASKYVNIGRGGNDTAERRSEIALVRPSKTPGPTGLL